MTLLAFGWEPELRGLLTVIIAVGVLMGSVYLILATNMGARLGFLVALTGLAGWMFLMGIIWWIYGLGFKGPAPTWDPVPGRTVLMGPESLLPGGVFDQPVHAEGATNAEAAAAATDEFRAEGWEELDPSSPEFGQAASSASDLLAQTDTYTAGQFTVTNVYDIGGERSPMIGEFDLLAFFHKPHHVVVEVTPNQVTRAERGRPPASAIPNDEAPRAYVYMVRNQGALRLPSIALTIGSGIIFFVLCWLLNSRDAAVERNRSAKLEPVPEGAVASAG